MRLKKYVTLVTIFAVTSLLLSCSNQDPTEESTSLNKENVEVVHNYKNDEEFWLTHRDEDLKYEIKYPALVEELGCDERVPIDFFRKDKMVYIEKRYYYAANCERKINTFDSIDERRTFAWKLIFKDIYNDENLNEFIKEIYGEECELGGKKLTAQKGVFDVSTYYDGKDLGESDCFINYRSVMKYHPAQHKAVSWNIGHEGKFWNEDINYHEGISDDNFFDFEMVDSFRFLD